MTTSSETVQYQAAQIQKAIELMQADFDNMTATIDSETTSWADVAKYAQLADLARDIIERYEEK